MVWTQGVQHLSSSDRSALNERLGRSPSFECSRDLMDEVLEPLLVPHSDCCVVPCPCVLGGDLRNVLGKSGRFDRSSLGGTVSTLRDDMAATHRSPML
eukprot:5181128-Pyramimonas_sp.AAC.2